MSATILTLSWPPKALPGLLFVGFVPLLLYAKFEGWTQKSWLAVYCSFILWGALTMGWISNLQAPNGIQLLIYMGHLFIPFLMSLPFGLSFALKRKFPTRSYYLFLPFFWMAYEYLEQFWELSFPLLNLGFGLSDFPFLIQYYEITGVRGGALLVLMCNIWIYLLISYWKTPRWKFLLLSGLSCGTLLLGFNYLLWNRAENIEVLSSKKIMVFQPNTNSYVEEEVSLPQSMSELDSLLDTMPHADILLTPEFYLKGSTQRPILLNDRFRRKQDSLIFSLANRHKTDLLLGAKVLKVIPKRKQGPFTRQNRTGDYFNQYNATLFYKVDGDKPQVYSKNQLIPFMERIPFSALYDSENDWPARWFLHGMNFEKLTPTLFKKGETSILSVICFESMFTNYIQQIIGKSNLIMVSSNEEWAQTNHAGMMIDSYHRTLAITFRKPVVRSSNGGPSSAFNALGKSVGSNTYGEKSAKIYPITTNSIHSFYASTGDLLGMVSFCFLIYFSYILIRKRR